MKRKKSEDKFIPISLAVVISIMVGFIVLTLVDPDWTFEKLFSDDSEITTVYASEIDLTGPQQNSGMQCDLISFKYPHYSVNGEMLPEEIQDYIFDRFIEFGVSTDYMPYWIAEIYQESSFCLDMTAEDGRDWGPCQLRDTWHKEFCEMAGHPEYDVKNNLYENIYVGTYLFCSNLKRADYDLEAAIKLYYNSGNASADAQYLSDVSRWFSTIEKIKEVE